MKILVVEDNEDNRILLTKQLCAHGHEVMAVADGVEALRQALAQPPDIIVSDILMPNMDGYQLCQKCKQHDKLRGIPFVFYTATYTKEEDEKLGLSLGANSFIYKPIEPDVLVQMLSEIVEKTQSGALAPAEVAPLEQSLFLSEYTKRIVAKLEDKVAELEVEITQRGRIEHNLNERMKELQCLYGIANLVERPALTLDGLYQEVVNLLPKGWQYPEVTCSKITIDDKEFRTNNYKETEWKQSADIKVHNAKIGKVEANYLEERPELDEGPFLKEERLLIDAVAERLGRITERKRAEQELSGLYEELKTLNLELEERVKERTRQLEEAVRAADVASQAKSDFLASMSHELRTPLNAVIGFSQVLQEQYFGKLNEKQTEYVTDILESGQHLLSLINDILDLAKIEAGKMELELSKVIIKDLLGSSLIMIKEKALVHGISLDINTTGDLEYLKIMVDERRIKQVIFNLLSNAVKFTPDGGAIRIEGKKKGKELIISVSDTGIGITLEKQAKVFEKFYQASGAINNKTSGTGLGLPVTRSIVEMHGGRIWVESEGPDKGSRFTFTLPI